jgi:hypothetical protein
VIKHQPPNKREPLPSETAVILSVESLIVEPWDSIDDIYGFKIRGLSRGLKIAGHYDLGSSNIMPSFWSPLKIVRLLESTVAT